MAIDALVRPLLQLALFRGLKPMQITEIVRRADRIAYRPGDVIIEEHAEADAAIVVVEGEAVRFSGPDLSGRAEPVQVGSLLAELGMFIETQHSSTIVARTAVNAMRIPRAEIREAMTEDPAIADHFVQKIAARLTTLADELHSIDSILASAAQLKSGPAVTAGAYQPYH